MNFLEFYRAIEQFRSNNPQLLFTFLSHDNLGALEYNARFYADIEDYVSPDQLNMLRDAIDLANQPSHSPEERARLIEALTFQKSRKTYRDMIQQLNIENDNIFTKIKHLYVDEPQAQALITELETIWKSRSPFSFLPSDLLQKLNEELDRFEQYVRMARKEFVNNQSYLLKNNKSAEQYTREKEALNHILLAAENLIESERKKLAAAMVERILLAPEEQINAEQELFFDDVVVETLRALVAFGLSPDFVQAFENNCPPRKALTRQLISEFSAYISTYGDESHQQALANSSTTHLTYAILREKLAGSAMCKDLVEDRLGTLLITFGNALEHTEKLEELAAAVEPTKSALQVFAKEFTDKVNDDDFGLWDFTLALPPVEMQQATDLAEKCFGDNQPAYDYFMERVIELFEKNTAIEVACKAAYKNTASELITSHVKNYTSNPYPLNQLFPAIAYKLSDSVWAQPRNFFNHVIKHAGDCVKEAIDANNYTRPETSECFKWLISQLASNWKASTNFTVEVVEKAQAQLECIRQIASKLYQLARASDYERAEHVSQTFIEKINSYFLNSKFNTIEETIAAAKLDMVLIIKADVFIRSNPGVSQNILNEYKNTIKKHVDFSPDWDSNKIYQQLGAAQKEIHEAYSFLNIKNVLYDLLYEDAARVNESSRFFMSSKRTRDKLAAFEMQKEILKHVQSERELSSFTENLLTNKEIVRGRNFFAFLPFFGSRTKTNLRTFRAENFRQPKKK